MLIEIPDPEILLGFVVAFFVGLFAFYMINRNKQSVKPEEKQPPSSYDRLDYYERQLIDMKIRLDSLDIEGGGPSSMPEIQEYKQSLHNTPQYENPEPRARKVTSKPQSTPHLDNSSTVDFVLNLITNKSMTSRDIQNASQRSREHTSRMMKKLFQEGYVQRNTKTKPYTYSITDKGKAKIGILEHMQNMAA